MAIIDLPYVAQAFRLDAAHEAGGVFEDLKGSGKDATLNTGAASFATRGTMEGNTFDGTQYLEFEINAVGEISVVVVAYANPTGSSGTRHLLGSNGISASDQLTRFSMSNNNALSMFSQGVSMSVTPGAAVVDDATFLAVYCFDLEAGTMKIAYNGGAFDESTSSYGRQGANCKDWAIGAHRATGIVIAGTWIGAVYILSQNFSADRYAADYAAAMIELKAEAGITDEGGEGGGPIVPGGGDPIFYEAGTNLVANPAAFGSWPTVSNVTVTTNTDTAPDGSLTADTITDNVLGTTGAATLQSAVVTFVNGQTYRASLIASSSADWIRFSVLNLTGVAASAFFKPSEGDVGTLGAQVTDAGISEDDDGYRQIWFTFTNAADTTGNLQIAIASADNTATILRDGTHPINVALAQIAVFP
jgi:hypothetical protein